MKKTYETSLFSLVGRNADYTLHSVEPTPFVFAIPASPRQTLLLFCREQCSCRVATLERFAKQQHNFSVNPVSPPDDSTVETSKHLSSRHDAPGADLVVGVTGEEGLAIGGPGERDTLGLSALLADLDVLGLELVDLALLLEIEDDDARGGGGAQPVTVGGEDKGVDLVTSVERVKVLALVQVPEHGGTVLATGSAKGTVGGDGDGVDVAGVTDVVSLDAAGGELPNL
jgi:hypothetical protein